MHRSRFSIMISRATLYVALITSAVALHANADCAAPHKEWQLELESFELLDGPGDATSEEVLLGSTASIQGSTKDPNFPDSPAHLFFSGTPAFALLIFEKQP